MADALGTPPPAVGQPGVVSAVDHRLDQAGLIAPQSSSLAVRTGVLHGPGTTALVTGTSATGTMTVNVAAHHWVTSRGTADGVYLGTKEASTTVPIAAAPGSNSRIDVVYVKQNDAASTISPDGSTGELYGVATGTAAVSPTKPAIPAGAEELATVQVAAGATSTLGAGVTITNTARQTVARGADVPVRTAAERDALTKYVGLTVKRLDLAGMVQRWTGTVWADPSDIPSFASNAARDSFFSGNLRAGAHAMVGGLVHHYTGSKWQYEKSGQVIYNVGAPTADAGGAFIFAHGLGVVPSSVQLTATQQASDLLQRIGVVKVLNRDATNVVVGWIRTDTSAYLGGNLLSFDWTVKS